MKTIISVSGSKKPSDRECLKKSSKKSKQRSRKLIISLFPWRKRRFLAKTMFIPS